MRKRRKPELRPALELPRLDWIIYLLLFFEPPHQPTAVGRAQPWLPTGSAEAPGGGRAYYNKPPLSNSVFIQY